MAALSAAYVPEDEQPGKKRIRLGGFTDAPPVHEGLFRHTHVNEGFRAPERSRGVVIRIVPGFLEAKEPIGDVNDLGLKSLPIQPRP